MAVDSRIDARFLDDNSRHGEEVIYNQYGETAPKRALIWPESRMLSGLEESGPLVGTVDGTVAGRGRLEAGLYPLAEMVNLYVGPQFRARGVASQIVGAAVRRAGELGYLAIHLQTELDNRAAQALYTKHGFVPAQQGQMLRMVRFLNHPALAAFLSRHPLALFDSAKDGDLWRLGWTDAVSRESVLIRLSGGSCQGDSGGFAPGVAAIEVRDGELEFRAEIGGPDHIDVGADFEVRVSITAERSGHSRWGCRLLLNLGFAPASGTPGAASVDVETGSTVQVSLPVVADESFNRDFWKECSYRSVPVTVEVFAGGCVFWLVKQVRLD